MTDRPHPDYEKRQRHKAHGKPMTDTKRIRKAASAIYITCDKEVADDISVMLSEAADDIDALKVEVARLREINGWLKDADSAKVLELQEHQRWIPVGERLPERKPELVLVARGTLIMQKAVLTLLRDAEGERYWTHWQYMPPAPEGG